VADLPYRIPINMEGKDGYRKSPLVSTAGENHSMGAAKISGKNMRNRVSAQSISP